MPIRNGPVMKCLESVLIVSSCSCVLYSDAEPHVLTRFTMWTWLNHCCAEFILGLFWESITSGILALVCALKHMALVESVAYWHSSMHWSTWPLLNQWHIGTRLCIEAHSLCALKHMALVESVAYWHSSVHWSIWPLLNQWHIGTRLCIESYGPCWTVRFHRGMVF